MASEVPMQEIDRYFRHEATDDFRWLIPELRKARQDAGRETRDGSGDDWTCAAEGCEAVNSDLRVRCRICKKPRNG